MKNTITILILFLFGILNAQETPEIVEVPPQIISDLDQIISKPIIAGCEEIQDKNGPEVESCFRQVISTNLTDRLMSKLDELGEIGLDRLNSIVTVVISKEGLMANVKIESTNDAKYGQIVEQQMKLLAANFPPITPAKSINGEAVHFMYRIPVTFVFQ